MHKLRRNAATASAIRKFSKGLMGTPVAPARWMNVIEAIRGRRAVRAYEARAVSETMVKALLRIAVEAPSAMNRQPWLFAVIQNVEQLKHYSDHAKTMLLAELEKDPKAGHYQDIIKNPDFNIFYNASTLIVIAGCERDNFADADCWLAAENLMLAAYDMGLGSCCIGFATQILNTTEVKAELGLPPECTAVAAIILGYPAATPPHVTRNEPKITAWIHEAQRNQRR